MGERGGINLYVMLGNSMVNYIDFLGQEPWHTTKKCTITIFYGHSDLSKLTNTEVEVCSGTTQVGCQSNVVLPLLPGVIDGAVGTDNDVSYGGPMGAGLEDSAEELFNKNFEVAREYAKDVLCKKTQNGEGSANGKNSAGEGDGDTGCCNKVKIEPKCVGTWWECNGRFPNWDNKDDEVKCE